LDVAEASAARENPNFVPLDSLFIPSWDIREGRPEEDIRSVARSLEEEGQIVPVLLGRETDKGIEIVDGVHRFLAAKRLGWHRIDGVQLASETDSYRAGVIANMGRVTMSNTDKVNVLNYLFETTDLSVERIGEKIGLSEASVYRYRNVIDGYNEIRSLYMSDGLQLKAAAKLNKVPDRDVAVSIAEEALTKGWSQQEIAVQAGNAKARLEMEAEARDASRQVGSQQAATHAREQMDAQEAQRGTQPAPPQQPAQAPQQGQPGPVEPEQPVEEEWDGPLCGLCGGPRTEEETMTVVLPEAIQGEVGIEKMEMCMDEGQAVLQLLNNLQEQAPKQG
jgi:ParB family chromosome partitioning protein